MAAVTTQIYTAAGQLCNIEYQAVQSRHADHRRRPQASALYRQHACISLGSASLMISISLAGACSIQEGQHPELRSPHSQLVQHRPPAAGVLHALQDATQVASDMQPCKQIGFHFMKLTGVSGTARRYSTITSLKHASRSFTVLKNWRSTEAPSGNTLQHTGGHEGWGGPGSHVASATFRHLQELLESAGTMWANSQCSHTCKHVVITCATLPRYREQELGQKAEQASPRKGAPLNLHGRRVQLLLRRPIHRSLPKGRQAAVINPCIKLTAAARRLCCTIDHGPGNASGRRRLPGHKAFARPQGHKALQPHLGCSVVLAAALGRWWHEVLQLHLQVEGRVMAK